MKLLIEMLGVLSILGATLADSGASAPVEADFYVAPNGNDNWSGKLRVPNRTGTDGPFATITKAQEAVRQAIQTTRRPYRVLIRQGTYYLSEPLVFGLEDSGAEKAPIIYAAYPGEKPVISAGRLITGWQKGPGPLWKAEVPETKSGKWYFHQLFVNGQRRSRARHPNEGYLTTAGPLPEITDPQKQRDEPAARLGFTYRAGDIKLWDNLDDVNIVLYYDWSTSRHWIEKLNEEKRTVRFTNPTGWPVCFWEKEQRYHLENFREALDKPGEWYLDRKTGILYYWPLAGENPSRDTVVAPRFEHILRLEGNPERGQFVEHIEFHGLSFQHADWQHDKTQQMEAQAAVYLTGAVFGRGVRACKFERCEVAHVGEYGLWLESGCKNNRISHCELYDLGGGGIRIGSEGFTDQENWMSDHNVVDNCFIHNGGNVFPDGVGVWIGHSSFNQITHNEICDLIYSGISVGWSWGYGPSGCHHNLIAWNHIHHLGFGVLSELSAIYTLGISTGTKICNNLLHDTYDYRYGSWGIGLDEGTSGVLVEDNILYKHGYGIGLHYGKDNLVRNNIIAFCRKELLGVGRIEEHQSMDFNHNICLTNRETLLGANWSRAKIPSDYNLYWDLSLGKEVVLEGWYLDEWQEETGRDKHSIVANPKFVNPEKYDFRLRPDTPASKIGFKPIDLSQVGLYGEPEWVQKPRKIKRKPIKFEVPPVAVALTSFEDGFESTSVGTPPKLATVSGETGEASIRVTDERAASGKHSLKFTDAAGLPASWQPHMFYSPKVMRGVAELSFDVRLEKGSVLVVECRDWRGEFQVGPSVRLVAGGELLANDKPVMTVPVGEWLNVKIVASVGKKSKHIYRLIVTKRGSAPTTFENLQMHSEKFVQLNWIGFISDATGPAVCYIDNVKLRSGPSEAKSR